VFLPQSQCFVFRISILNVSTRIYILYSYAIFNIFLVVCDVNTGCDILCTTIIIRWNILSSQGKSKSEFTGTIAHLIPVESQGAIPLYQFIDAI
jgi:hypothetical protein